MMVDSVYRNQDATTIGLSTSHEDISEETADNGQSFHSTIDYPEDDEDVQEGASALLLGQNLPGENVYAVDKSAEASTIWMFSRGLLIEAAPTLFLTVIGMVFTGELLERVSRWKSLQAVDELFILIPIINNLKGNLEMNLSARLGTSASIGFLDTLSNRTSIVQGNLSLIQVQALLVSALAAILSFLLGLVLPPRDPMPQEMPQDSAPQIKIRQDIYSMRKLHRHYSRLVSQTDPTGPSTRKSRLFQLVMVLSTAMTAASFSGLILGSFMCSLVLVCRRLRLNPDNIAPPVAGCLGDLLTLTLLSLCSTAFLRLPSFVPSSLLLPLVGLVVLMIQSSSHNPQTKNLIWTGWSPLLGAMMISCGTGLVLDNFVKKYEGFGMMAVVISGLPGSVGAVSISRFSTCLHAAQPLPAKVLWHGDSANTHRRRLSSSLQISAPPSHRPFLTSAMLFLISLPVSSAFVGFVYAAGWMDLPFVFVALFLVFFCVAVTVSLLMAHYLTLIFWAFGCDPDNYCLPVHSALTDLCGQLMLVACYELAGQLGTDVNLRR
ncbi:hypothetical protein FRC03_010280 [Tulasnella sp. 419]|nr:hypothetical protein FRC02_011250 [Tulasnella sp. 418]KAG8957297.1 hypothetical protein FRC03_010280 [Tulasnella sp. 419]